MLKTISETKVFLCRTELDYTTTVCILTIIRKRLKEGITGVGTTLHTLLKMAVIFRCLVLSSVKVQKAVFVHGSMPEIPSEQQTSSYDKLTF